MIILERKTNSLVRGVSDFFFGGDDESVILAGELRDKLGESWVGSPTKSGQSNNLRGRRVYLIGDSTEGGEDGDSNCCDENDIGETDNDEHERSENRSDKSSFLPRLEFMSEMARGD